MPNPKLTFACELDTIDLVALFSNPQPLVTLQDLNASIALALRDLSAGRAAVVRKLNAAGIPVIAWLLVPEEHGYWFNLDNAPQALAAYDAFMAWSVVENLQWAGVALNIEPDIQVVGRLLSGDWPVLFDIVARAVDGTRLRRGKMFYKRLVARIRVDDFLVATYAFPFILDERQAGATLLQRLLGIVDLNSDLDVLMLYTSFVRGIGPGILWSYAPEAGAVAVGSTGGGVTVAGLDQIAPLTWDELARDLRLAHHWSDNIHIFSLEGAVKQGFLSRLLDFDWSAPQPMPLSQFKWVQRARRLGQGVLRISAHPQWLMVAGMGLLGAWVLHRRRKVRFLEG